MSPLVEVRFKGNRKAYFTWEDPEALGPGQEVVVSVDRGQDLGLVSAVGDLAAKKCGVGCSGCALAQPRAPDGAVVRRASPEDTHLARQLRKAEDDVRRKVIERVTTHRLTMKVSDAEWQWDRRKLTIYFTAEQRVDFRALVRDLAGLFRTRIELRQIGARDEAKRLEGVGRCGRLLCCLRYEHEFYVQSRKRFPKEGKVLTTARGPEKVQAVDIFRERVLLRSEDGATRAVALADLRAELAEAPGVETPPAAPPPPAELVTFDEGALTVSPEDALASLSPEPGLRRRRRRRGRRGSGKTRRLNEAGPEHAAPGDEPADEPEPPANHDAP